LESSVSRPPPNRPYSTNRESCNECVIERDVVTYSTLKRSGTRILLPLLVAVNASVPMANTATGTRQPLMAVMKVPAGEGYPDTQNVPEDTISSQPEIASVTTCNYSSLRCK
jgi:hypothetical protein